MKKVNQCVGLEQDLGDLREKIHLSYLYKSVHLGDNYHSHCFLLLHYIIYSMIIKHVTLNISPKQITFYQLKQTN